MKHSRVHRSLTGIPVESLLPYTNKTSLSNYMQAPQHQLPLYFINGIARYVMSCHACHACCALARAILHPHTLLTLNTHTHTPNTHPQPERQTGVAAAVALAQARLCRQRSSSVITGLSIVQVCV